MAISSWVIHDEGKLGYDHAARVVHEFDREGIEFSQRPYTTEENARADIELAGEAALQNEVALKGILGDTALSELQTQVLGLTNAALTTAFQANPAPILKLYARVLRRIIRLLVRRLEGTD